LKNLNQLSGNCLRQLPPLPWQRSSRNQSERQFSISSHRFRFAWSQSPNPLLPILPTLTLNFFAIFDLVQSLAGDLNLRLGPLASNPSPLLTSIRGAFLGPSQLPAATPSNTLGGWFGRHFWAMVSWYRLRRDAWGWTALQWSCQCCRVCDRRGVRARRFAEWLLEPLSGICEWLRAFVTKGVI
jgi:hypothetical protein